MKIVIPILGFGKAGGYRVLSKFATEWMAMGHEVTFLCHKASDLPYFPTKANLFWIDSFGRKAERNQSKSQKEIHPLLRLVCLCIGLSRYFKESQIILANHNLTAWSVFFSNLSSKKFYYVQAYEPEYSQLAPGIKNRVLEYMAWLSYFFPLKRIVNSPIYLKYKNLSADLAVYPGLDESIFKPLEKKEVNGKFVVGCIGRKEPQKGIDFVYQAMKEVAEEDTEIILYVAYSDIYEGERLPFEVNVVKPQNDEELSNFYRSLDVLIAPGLVQLGAAHYPVMEAMSCGIPVITTGYFPADEANSWIVPVSDSTSIKESILFIKGNPKIAMEKVKRGLTACAPLSWKSVASQMMNYMEKSKSSGD
jgi:glycosyltransferase involved in cell wall biosynthesis